MTPVAIYARSSKDRADISCATQVRELTELASSRSMTVVQTYEDAVESGASEDRPAFSQLAADLRNPRRGWSVLLVYDTSRIGRRRWLAQAFKHAARKAGVQIIYAKLPADIDPISDIVLQSVFEAMDEVHSLMSRDKALAGMRENVRRGWRAGGRPPLGYRLEHVPTGTIRDGKPVTKSRLVPSQDAPKVAAYLRRRAAGEPRPAALRALGLNWKANSLVDVERRALVYAGHLVWNQHAAGKRLPRDQWVIQRDAHPAIITEAEAEAVMAGLDTTIGERVSAGKRAASSALLSGLLWAPDGRMWRSAGPHYRLEGVPGRKVRREVLDGAVTAAVLQDVATEGFLAGLIEASRARAVDSGPREQLQKDLVRLRRERDRAARLALESDDSVYTALVVERGRQIAGLERQLALMAEDDEATRQLRALTPAVLRDIIESADPAELVHSLVGRVVVSHDLAGTIEYRQVGAVSMASPRRPEGYVPALCRPLHLAA